MGSLGAARMIRGVLGVGAAVFLISAIALLVLPATLAGLLGLQSGESVDWVMRMLGAALLALAGQMWLVRRADHAAVRGAGAVMIVAGGLMTILTVTLPGDWTLLRWAYLGFGLTFVALYAILIAVSIRAEQR